MLVHAGTTNAAKLEAVRRGLGALLPDVRVEPYAARSGVSEQPIGLPEIVRGAIQRAHAAWAAGRCDLACGIEDGLVGVPQTATGYMNVGCAALHDGQRDFLGLSAGFEYPAGCVEAALPPRRMPVGDSFARLFPPSPEGWGNIGRLTGGALTRVDYGAQAVTCAAVRMLHPELYGESRP